MTGTIEVDVKGYGTFRVHAKDLDWAIEHLLPASPAVLASLYEEVTGTTVPDPINRPTVSEFLIMLTAQYRGDAGQEVEPVPYYEVARISQLTYRAMGDPPHHYEFVEGRGFNHDGQAVPIKPPSTCEVIPWQSPASHLLRSWPDIKDRVPQGFVRNVLSLSDEEGL